MDLKQLLSNSLEERFRADCVVKAIGENICQMAKQRTFKKYESHKITRNGMEFELLGVTSDFNTWGYEKEKVRISLVFTVCSKLPKEKRERLELFKEGFNTERYVPYSNSKFPLWEEHAYRVELEDVLNDTINLKVD